MTREEAIRILKNFSLCGVYHQLIHMNDTDSEAISMAIKALEQPERKGKWIPCSERLPFAEYGESQSVLTTCEHRNPDYGDDYKWVKLLYYNGGVWCYPTGETYEERVIAWMPLPAPYKEES